MANPATVTLDLVPVPGPEDAEHLAAIGLLLGCGQGWQPKFQPGDRLGVAKARGILKELLKLPLRLEVRDDRLHYGPPASLSLMELAILVAWHAPLVLLLSAPKRGARHG